MYRFAYFAAFLASFALLFSGVGKAQVPAATWISLGPAPEGDAAADDPTKNDESGRIIAIAIHPTNPKIIYMGSAGGGIFRSLDGGNVWSRIDMPDPTGASAAVGQSQAIGSIAFSPTDPSTLFVGTGQARGANNAMFGVGVYVVKNADAAFQVSGPFNLDATGKDIFTGRSISKIIVNPADPNTILIATGEGGFAGYDNFGNPPKTANPLRGLYRSNNALAAAPTFTRLTAETETPVADLAFEPGNFSNVIYSVIGQGNDDGGVFRTTNALDPVPAFTKTLALPFNKTSRLAINKVGDVVTVLLATNEKPAGADAEGMVRRSTDGGVTFPETIPAANGFAGANVNVQIDPRNASIFYLGGSTNGSGKNIKVITETLDGGATFTPNGAPYTNGVHPDTQIIQIAPSDSSIVYVGGDGGTWKTVKGGLDWQANNPNWLDLNNPTWTANQLNSLAIHPKIKTFMIGGAQDNGSPFQGPDGTWVEMTGGDGGVALIDQTATATSDVTIYRTGAQDSKKDLAVERITVPGTSLGKTSKQIKEDSVKESFGIGGGATANGIKASDKILFYNPMALGPGGAGNPDVLYFGTDRLYRSTNRAQTMTIVSQGPFVKDKEVSAIGISPQDDNVRIVGIVNGQVFATTTGSTPLAEVTISSGGQPIGNYVSRAIIDPNNKTTAYVAFTGYGLVDSHIWKTTNLDASPPTWTAAAKGIPDVPVDALVIDPRDSNQIYAGTDIGVYNSSDGGATWTSYGAGLPRVPVFDLAIQKDFGLLRAATYGLGAWEIPAATRPAGTVASNTASTPGGTAPNSGVTSSSSQTDPQAFTLSSGNAEARLAPAATGANTNSIAINDSGTATPFPSPITVTGLSGVINKVSVQLLGLSHGYPDDLRILLVSPAGQSVVLMGAAGGSYALSGVDITFDDSALDTLPHEDQIVSGKYRPASFADGTDLPLPAPSAPYGSALAAFNGSAANGDWKLYIADVSKGSAGQLAGGWNLTINTQADAALPFITLNDVRVTEGVAGTTGAEFTAKLSQRSTQTVTVNYATADDTASSPGDYAATSGTLTFAPGETTRTFIVPVNGGTTPGPAKSFFVNLSAPVNAAVADDQATGLIANKNVIPDIAINDTGEPKQVDEASGDTGADLTVSLSAPSQEEVRVDYTTVDGTMVAGVDYTAASGTLIFAPGETDQVVSVQLLPETVSQPNGTLYVTLSNASNGNIVKATGTIVVVLDMSPGIVGQPSEQVALEGGNASFGVEAEGADPMSYQWMFNGTPIAGATNQFLTITNVKSTDAGTYSVIVTNAYGDDESDDATLTVIPRKSLKAVAGYYQGVLGGSTFDQRTSGLIKLYVSPLGTLSGVINFGGVSHSFLGKLTADGMALVVIGTGPSRLVVQLQLSESDTNGVTGTVTSGGVTTSFFAGAALVGKTAAKQYTVILPRNPAHPEAAYPQGDGYGVVNIGSTGSLKFTGKLGDGTTVSQGTHLSPGGYWAVYLPAYANSGSVSGWVQFRSLPNVSDLDGTLDWFRPDHFQKQYPAGFTTTIDLVGSVYTKPAPGQPALDLGIGGTTMLGGGNLAQTLSAKITIDGTSHVIVTDSSNQFSMAISTANGLFNGKFLTPEGKKRTFTGAVLQNPKQTFGADNLVIVPLSGAGYFQGVDGTGYVEIQPIAVLVP